MYGTKESKSTKETKGWLHVKPQKKTKYNTQWRRIPLLLAEVQGVGWICMLRARFPSFNEIVLLGSLISRVLGGGVACRDGPLFGLCHLVIVRLVA